VGVTKKNKFGNNCWQNPKIIEKLSNCHKNKNKKARNFFKVIKSTEKGQKKHFAAFTKIEKTVACTIKLLGS
jgi:hypothetical protein